MSLVDSLQLAALIREQPPSVTAWLFLIALGGIILSVFLGNVLAKSFKYKEHSARFSVVLSTIVIAVMPFVAQILLGNAEQAKYQEAETRWEAHQDRETLSDEAIDELKEGNASLEVRQ